MNTDDKIRADAEEYWRTHKEGGGTDLELRRFCDGWLAHARSLQTTNLDYLYKLEADHPPLIGVANDTRK